MKLYVSKGERYPDYSLGEVDDFSLPSDNIIDLTEDEVTFINIAGKIYQRAQDLLESKLYPEEEQ